jgi:hypothetical protein
MGSAQSSIVQQTVSVVNEAMTNLVTENSTGGTAKAINGNSLDINMDGATITKCSITAMQKITASQKLSVMSQFQSLNSMQTQMTTALQNAADQQSKSTQGALATALNVQTSKQSINQAIANRVKTNVTQKNFASVNAFIQNLNKGKLSMKGATIVCEPGEGINITQEIINNQIVEMLANAVIGNAVTGTTNASASASSTQAMESKQQGLVDALSGLISGPFIAIGVIIIVLAVLSFLMRGKISGLIEKKNSIDLAKAAQKFGRSFFGRASRR